MDAFVVWLKLGAVQGILYGLQVLLDNYTSLQLPVYLFPIIAAGISAAMSWLRNQYGVEATRKVARATRAGQPPFLAGILGV